MRLAFPLLVVLAAAHPLFGQKLPVQTARLVTARKADVVADVEFPRKDSARYAGEMNRILRMVGSTGLYVHYMLVSADKADIIVVIKEDVTILDSETVSIEVRDADTNAIVYSESRDLVVLENEVKRLVEHFLATVEQEKALANLAIHWNHVNKCDSPPCPKGEAADVWLDQEHLYESQRVVTPRGDGLVKLETHCSVARADSFPWTGSCTYTLFWSYDSKIFKSAPDCTVTTAETIASVSATEITGRSQKIDFAPLRQSPPACPVPNSEYTDFDLAVD